MKIPFFNAITALAVGGALSSERSPHRVAAPVQSIEDRDAALEAAAQKRERKNAKRRALQP